MVLTCLNNLRRDQKPGEKGKGTKRMTDLFCEHLNMNGLRTQSKNIPQVTMIYADKLP